MRWQKHVKAARGEQAVERFEIAEWIAAGRRAPMDAFRPAAETTDTERVGIDDLDVVTCGGPNTLRNSRAVRLEPSENRILAPTLPSGWPSRFRVRHESLQRVELGVSRRLRFRSRFGRMRLWDR